MVHMSSTPKAKPKKLRDGSTIAVDLQIIRWRSRLRKEGKALGRHMEKAKELREKRKEERAKPEPRLRKWYD
jgi:hypothetical protein